MKSRFWCKNNSKCAIWICQWIIVCGVLCWNTIEYTCQSWPTSCWAEWPFCRPHGMICFTSLLIRQLYHFLQQISIVGCCNWWAMTLWTLCLNTEWAIGTWYSSLKHMSCWWKSSAKFDSLFVNFNVQLYVHLKKWTLKFKLLYLLDQISYFNIICRICCLNAHIQSLKVWLKSVLPWLKYIIFSRGLFFIGAPCIYILWCLQTEYEGQAKKYMDVIDPTNAIITVGGDGTVSEVILVFFL